VVGRESETRKAHHLGTVSKNFYERFFSDGIKRDERIIYQITIGGPNY